MANNVDMSGLAQLIQAASQMHSQSQQQQTPPSEPQSQGAEQPQAAGGDIQSTTQSESNAPSNDNIVAVFKRLGMSDSEIKAILEDKRQQTDQETASDRGPAVVANDGEVGQSGQEQDMSLNVKGLMHVMAEYARNLKDTRNKYEAARKEIDQFKETSQKRKKQIVESAMEKLVGQVPTEIRDTETFRNQVQSLASGLLRADDNPDSLDDTNLTSAATVIEAVASANAAQTSALEKIYQQRKETEEELNKNKAELKKTRELAAKLESELARFKSQYVDTSMQFEQPRQKQSANTGASDDADYTNMMKTAAAAGIGEDTLRRLYEASSAGTAASPLEAPQVVQAVASDDPDASFFKMFQDIDTNALANRPVRDFVDKDFLANLGINQ